MKKSPGREKALAAGGRSDRVRKDIPAGGRVSAPDSSKARSSRDSGSASSSTAVGFARASAGPVRQR